jgi:hypothetical protein
VGDKLTTEQLIDAALKRRRARRQVGKFRAKSIFVESAEGEFFSQPVTSNGDSSNGHHANGHSAEAPQPKDKSRSDG